MGKMLVCSSAKLDSSQIIVKYVNWSTTNYIPITIFIGGIVYHSQMCVSYCFTHIEWFSAELALFVPSLDV